MPSHLLPSIDRVEVDNLDDALVGLDGSFRKLKAKVLLINTVEDVANPPELGTVERAMKAIHNGRYVLIPYSDKTHGHFTHYYAAVWKPYLIDFMGTLGPTAPKGKRNSRDG